MARRERRQEGSEMTKKVVGEKEESEREGGRSMRRGRERERCRERRTKEHAKSEEVGTKRQRYRKAENLRSDDGWFALAANYKP